MSFKAGAGVAVPAFLATSALLLAACTEAPTVPPGGAGPQFHHQPDHAGGGGKGGDSGAAANPVIAFAQAGGNRDRLVVMDEDGGNQTVVHTAPHIRFPSWSPDGSRIVFRADSETQARLLTLEIEVVDGKPQAKNEPQVLVDNDCGLTSTPSIGCEPAWSPNGGVIAFTERLSPSSSAKLWLINADGTNRTLLYALETEEGFVELRSPTWSSDGDRIAVVEGPRRITVLEVNSDPVEPVVSRQLDYEGILDFISDVDWARTGAMLALDAMLPVPDCCTRTIFTVDLNDDEAGEPPTLVEVAEGRTPTWSRDATKLAIVQGSRGTIVSVVVATGGTTTLASNGLNPDWARE
jgi:dipeptidyl aminopeptidase/acylaminoacyl peptidase